MVKQKGLSFLLGFDWNFSIKMKVLWELKKALPEFDEYRNRDVLLKYMR